MDAHQVSSNQKSLYLHGAQLFRLSACKQQRLPAGEYVAHLCTNVYWCLYLFEMD